MHNGWEGQDQGWKQRSLEAPGGQVRIVLKGLGMRMCLKGAAEKQKLFTNINHNNAHVVIENNA